AYAGYALVLLAPSLPLLHLFYTATASPELYTLSLHDALPILRQQGYAVDDEEYDFGVRCVAAPVFDYRGKAVGAIGISGPAGRMTLERVAEFATVVREVSRNLSDRLSFNRA